jgi:hypothetical protein
MTVCDDPFLLGENLITNNRLLIQFSKLFALLTAVLGRITAESADFNEFLHVGAALPGPICSFSSDNGPEIEHLACGASHSSLKLATGVFFVWGWQKSVRDFVPEATSDLWLPHLVVGHIGQAAIQSGHSSWRTTVLA